MLHSNRRIGLLIVVLLAGLALRVWYATDRERFPDEKYSLRNVESVLRTHSLLPAQVYYPSPVFFVPPAVVLSAAEAMSDLTGRPALSVWSDGKLNSNAVLLCRLLQVLYGTASLFLTYLLGCELFSPRVGLFGSAALAFMPLHIRASAYFKPDAQLVFTVLLAFLLSLWALRGDRLTRYGIAGAAIALAMSGKLLGAAIALPLAIGVLSRSAMPWRRRWTFLLTAGLTAAVLFVLLNPHFRFYLTWLNGLQDDYARRAGAVEAMQSEIPIRFVQALLGDLLHGPWIGTLALVGLAWMTTAAGRRDEQRAQQAGEWLLFLLFPLFFTTAFALSTPYFKSNNFLSVLPFTALAAGWAIDRVAVRNWTHRRRWATITALAAVIAAAVLPGVVFTYRSRVPTTLNAAKSFLNRGLQPRLGRWLVAEEISDPVVGWQRRTVHGDGLVALREVHSLAQVGARRIAATDGFLFHEARLEGDGASFFRNLIRPRRLSRMITVRPSLFRLRGAALVAVVDRWKDCGRTGILSATWVRSERHYVIRLPEGSPEAPMATLSLWIPGRLLAGDTPWRRELRLGDHRIPMQWVSRQNHRHLFTSERMRWPASERSVIVDLRRPPGGGPRPEAVAAFWQRRTGKAAAGCRPGRSAVAGDL